MRTLNYCLFALMSFCLWTGCTDAGGDVVVTSPDKRLSCTIKTDRSGHLSYAIEMDGEEVIHTSSLGIIVDGDDLGNSAVPGKPKMHAVKESYKTRGVHSRAVNNYKETVIPVSGGSSGTQWCLDVRVFPDAVAYRYRVPGEGTRKIEGETSNWNVMEGTTLWYQSNRKRDYEMPYAKMMPDTVTVPVDLMTTSTFKLPENRGYLMIGEANLVKYSDMALRTSGNSRFESLFHNSPEGWMNEGEIVSPWRVTVLTRNLNELVNTDVFRNLCPPPSSSLADAAWIKPGKSTWGWMVSRAPKFNEQQKWVDWTSELGLEYYLVDDGWQRWTEGDKGQWELMKEVVDYAATKDVGIWAWVRTAEQMSKYIANAKSVGVVGLKVDFMGAADPDWVQWYEDILKETADVGMMVIFHGSNKPSGRERTWPHEMTRESIRGREMGKQPALHDASLPFTRFVVGHADYTPTDFRPEVLKGSTWAHELAMSVIFTSPLMVLSGDPQGYLESEALDFLRALPTEWDETIVLPGSEIGETAAFARRKGNEWFIGILNGEARDMEISLDFLGKGNYIMEEFRDESGRTDAWSHQKHTVNKHSNITVSLNRDGGFVARIMQK